MSMDRLDVVRLLVSELVTNAIEHGRGAVLLLVVRDGDSVRVSVDDENPDPPVVIESQSLMETGAGMRLVVTLADNWGVVPRSDGRLGKRVWFALT
jgi:anti-sigma regulatory factor (Ser/Thr protein kinase)